MSQSIRMNPVQILEHTILVKNTDIDDEILDHIVDARNMHLSKGIVLENCSLSSEYLVFLRELPHLSLLGIQDCSISDLGAKCSLEFGRHQEISDDVLKILENFRYEPFFDPPLKEEMIEKEPVIEKQFADRLEFSIYILHSLMRLGADIRDSALCCHAGKAAIDYYTTTSFYGKRGEFFPLSLTSADIAEIDNILTTIQDVEHTLTPAEQAMIDAAQSMMQTPAVDSGIVEDSESVEDSEGDIEDSESVGNSEADVVSSEVEDSGDVEESSDVDDSEDVAGAE